MKIIDGEGHNIPAKYFKFPDGQVHAIPELTMSKSATIKARIRNGDELLTVLLVNDALRFNGVKEVNLDIVYMLGARMDRRMTRGEPFTLKVVADCLKGKFDRITVLDPHSEVTNALLDSQPIHATKYVREVLNRLGWSPKDSVGLVIPDAGATHRDEDMNIELGGYQLIQCLKVRDPATGKLTGFKVLGRNDLPPKVLIVDDLCDGGGTFAGLADKLHQYGVKWVGLYVTHGVFSKGYSIEGIDHSFTTTSYRPREEVPADANVTILGEDLA